MSRWLNFILFFGILLLVLGCVHYYLYRRLVVLPQLPASWLPWLRALFICLALAPPLSF
jgi:hypothetical protein